MLCNLFQYDSLSSEWPKPIKITRSPPSLPAVCWLSNSSCHNPEKSRKGTSASLDRLMKSTMACARQALKVHVVNPCSMSYNHRSSRINNALENVYPAPHITRKLENPPIPAPKVDNRRTHETNIKQNKTKKYRQPTIARAAGSRHSLPLTQTYDSRPLSYQLTFITLRKHNWQQNSLP